MDFTPSKRSAPTHRGGFQLQILAFLSAGKRTPRENKPADASRVAAAEFGPGRKPWEEEAGQESSPGGAAEIIDRCKRLCRPLTWAEA
jgi:hypothetical protein